MADRFYPFGEISNEDNEMTFMNYAAGIQQQQHHQNLNHHNGALLGAGNLGQLTCAGALDVDYIANNSAYFTNNSIGLEIAADQNNNNNSSNQNACRQSPLLVQNYNKIATSNAAAMNKYKALNAYGGYVQSAADCTGLMGNQLEHQQQQQHYAMHHPHGNVPVTCHYAHNNGSASCFNRNRYMPYNHNRACAAAAAANASTLSGNCGAAALTSTSMPFHYQQFAPIYQCGPMSSTSLIASNAYERTAAAAAAGTQKNPLGFNYANAAPSTLLVDSVNGAVNCNTTTISNTGVVSGAELLSSTPATSTLSSSMSSSASSTSSSSSSSSSLSSSIASTCTSTNAIMYNGQTSTGASTVSDPNQMVTLQINNLDYSMDETSLRNFLLNQLKPITPVISLVFEGSSFAKVTVPDMHFAKQVVAYMHRKKIGHKRMVVSYTRDSSLTEINTLRCQVAGLLKDVPHYTLPMYKFRELFQSRFKTSISVLDLYKMQDICSINADDNDEKFISLQPELVNSLESSPLMEGLQHSVPYCTIHFKREQHKGWAEQDIEPIPNVFMTISEIQQIIYPLLKGHPGDIPVASLVHCIEGELNIQISRNENGVNLEHLVCCVHGIQIQMNNFGIKILGWLETENGKESNNDGRGLYLKNSSVSDPLYQISREVVELVKMAPKSTMKFNRFIPAYHNHFGKQCRVADYGYTKLIELFEALSAVIQIMGDGENRQITLTHRTQIRRFTSDLLRILRAHGNKSVLLSQLPVIFSQTQNRKFDVTDYGVCDIIDILDGLVNSNIVVVSTVQNGKDILISIPKRKQTANEIEKTCVFAGEVVELFRHAPQYSILFQKFVRSYHYHFAFQCRLSDYGFMKLADLMEAINGVVELDFTNDEDKKVFLSPKVARRVFAEQIEDLIREFTGSSKTCIKLDEVLKFHKKKFGYQLQPQTLGVSKILDAIRLLPYVELIENENGVWIICHNDDAVFRTQCYRSCKVLLLLMEDKQPPQSQHLNQDNKSNSITMKYFINSFNDKYNEMLSERSIIAMKHAIEMTVEDDTKYVRITKFMMFLVSLVRLLEQRNSMAISDIKNALDIGIKKCFEFGYPNLYSMLRSYPDVFVVNLGATHERSEVTLAPQSDLHFNGSSHHHLFGSIKLPSTKNKSTSRNSGSRAPLCESNNRQQLCSGLPLMQAKSQNQNHNSDYPPKLQTMQQTTLMANKQHAAVSSSAAVLSSSCSTLSSSLYSSSSSSSSTLNTSSMNISQNKENSFNNSLLAFNASLNSSSNSISDFNSSIGSGNVGVNSIGYSSTKLWDRRHNNYDNNVKTNHYSGVKNIAAAAGHNVSPNQQHLFAHQPPPPPAAVHSQQDQSNIFELASNIHMCPMYEPPKPDTPPSDNMPFWIDPIWANTYDAKPPTNNSLNIKLPEFKMFNVLPMLLSPYTLSKTENLKQQMFSFENHDRKIA